MLMRRMHINNPSASRAGIAKLVKHRLDFWHLSKQWAGAVATVVPDNTCHVWGALWIVSTAHLKTMDKQEGVAAGIYKVYQVRVEMMNGKSVECRSYHLTNQPSKLEPGKEWPDERKPTKSYLNTMIAGAEESGLPAEYIQQLQTIQYIGDNNGNHNVTHSGDNNGEHSNIPSGDSGQVKYNLWLLVAILFNSTHVLLQSTKCR